MLCSFLHPSFLSAFLFVTIYYVLTYIGIILVGAKSLYIDFYVFKCYYVYICSLDNVSWNLFELVFGYVFLGENVLFYTLHTERRSQ